MATADGDRRWLLSSKVSSKYPQGHLHNDEKRL